MNLIQSDSGKSKMVILVFARALPWSALNQTE